MSNDDVIFETNNVIVYHDGYCAWKTGHAGAMSIELAKELARLYRLLEDKEDDGR